MGKSLNSGRPIRTFLFLFYCYFIILMHRPVVETNLLAVVKVVILHTSHFMMVLLGEIVMSNAHFYFL